jgi:hypothetical protein
VHEFSDRLLVITSGLGLFHYWPDARNSRELRSVVVEAGDAVLFTRAVVHTFTAPLGDLTLLSYHAPFFEFDDTRQFTKLSPVGNRDWKWGLRGLVVKSMARAAHKDSVEKGFDEPNANDFSDSPLSRLPRGLLSRGAAVSQTSATNPSRVGAMLEMKRRQ